MSHEIIKKIRIENNQVLITSESNNVFPKYYKERLSTYCTDILINEGMEALNLNLLEAYEQGVFQNGIENKWSRAIDRIRHTEEYKLYDWRLSNYSDDNCPIKANRATKEFKVFLLSSLNIKPSKERYILKKNVCGSEYYVLRVTTRHIKVTADKLKAKVFKIKQDADNICSMFPQYQLLPI